MERRWPLAVMAVMTALLVAIPSILAALHVSTSAVVGSGVGIAAVAGVFAGISRDFLAEALKQRSAQATALADGCLVIDGRLPKVSQVTDPVRLGVHRARSSEAGEETPPAYVPRDIDIELRKRLAKSSFVLLVGDSAVGKTRSAYEAIAAAVPGHVLVAPGDGAAFVAALNRVTRLPRCVLWLDDVERFLGSDGLTRTRISQILDKQRHHRLIVATARTRALDPYIDPSDRNGAELNREVIDALEQAHRIDLARAFTSSERERAAIRTRDSRIGDALAHSADFSIPEYLAAAPDLLHLWQANADGDHRRGAALVSAAIDVRRSGLTDPIPRELIEELHERRLSRRGRIASEETLDEAWDWATQLRMTTALLTPGNDAEHFEVFDYLVDYCERAAAPGAYLPEAVMLACLRHASPGDAMRLAALADYHGSYVVARSACDQACAAYTRELGPDHPDTLDSRAGRAWTDRNLGLFRAAEAEIREVLDARTRVLGPEHADTLNSRSNLALILRDLARFSEAEAENREVLDIRARILGPEHPDTLISRSNLAWTLSALNRPEEAEAENRAVIEIRLRVLGADHPNTLGSRNNLADVLRRRGRYNEAESEARIAVSAYSRSLGPSHPSTLNSRSNLAAILRSAGRLKEAEAEATAVRADYFLTLGGSHPSTLRSRSNLALILSAAGRHIDAEAEHRATMGSRTRVLGVSHPDTLNSAANLAAVLQILGRESEAEELQRQVADVRMNILGPDHPDTETSQANLADTQRRMQEAGIIPIRDRQDLSDDEDYGDGSG